MPADALPQPAVRYIAAVVAIGAVALAGAGLHLAGSPPAGWVWLTIPLIIAAIFLTQRRAFVFHFRGQRTTNVFDEPAIALAFLVAPFGVALLSLAVGLAAAQVVSRRRLVKAAYNLSAYVISAAIAGLAFLAAPALGVPAYFAAIAPALVYPLVANILLAGVFSQLESVPAFSIFKDRLLHQMLLNQTLGVGIVLSGYALWQLSPLALLGLVPFGLLASSFIDLHARAEREGRIRARLEEVTLSLMSLTRIDDVAETLLDCCGELFLAGEATLVLDGKGAPGRAWTRTFEGGPVRGRDVEAHLVGRMGERIGTLTISPAQRAPNANALEVDRPLVNVLARQVASALELAEAFRALVALKNEHEGIVRSMPAGVLKLDARGDVAHWNERFVSDIGEPRAAWALLRTSPDLARNLDALLRGEPFEAVEVQIEHRVFAVSGESLHGAGPGAVLLFHDITSRREAELGARTNVVARSLVRRIVLDLVSGVGASEFAITTLGRRLAAEVKATSAEDFAAAFRTMGLGQLRVAEEAAGTYVFEADDLLERRTRASQPTCHLARGYLEGAVALLHERGALGAEVRCQSQGHARCRFVVKPREQPMPAKAHPRKASATPAK